MSKTGPKPVLDDVKRGEICALLTQGNSRRAAARYVGCSPNTIANTARRDEAFAHQLRHAEMNCELQALQHINAAGGKSWRAAAWILERTRPERFEKVSARQPTYDQICDFWDQCAGTILSDLPVEYRGPIQQKLNKAAGKFSRLTQAAAGQSKPPTVKTESAAPSSTVDSTTVRLLIASFEERERKLRAALPPEYLEQEERERVTREVDELRAYREEFEAERLAGNDSEEPDWLDELHGAEVPSSHPAYREFAQPLTNAATSPHMGQWQPAVEQLYAAEKPYAAEAPRQNPTRAGVLNTLLTIWMAAISGLFSLAAPHTSDQKPVGSVCRTEPECGDGLLSEKSLASAREANVGDTGQQNRCSTPGPVRQPGPTLRPTNVDQQHPTPPAARSTFAPTGEKTWPPSVVAI